MDILFDDNQIIVCIKPPGLLSVSDGREPSLAGALRTYLDEKGEKAVVGTVHRLDQCVGGVMVFGKNASATANLCRQVQEGTLRKVYTAAVQGQPDAPSGNFVDLLFKDSKKNKSYVVKRMRKGVREASLDYEVLSTAQRGETTLSLVRIHLHTGRTHQIRVQFSSRKMPLLGDGKYGSKDNKCDTALWSTELLFSHPKTGEAVRFAAELPDDYPWNLFCREKEDTAL